MPIVIMRARVRVSVRVMPRVSMGARAIARVGVRVGVKGASARDDMVGSNPRTVRGM